MNIIDRCDLHNHTQYSNIRLVDALPTPEGLIDRAIEIGLKGIAITDHEFLGAHPKAIKHALEIKEKYPDFKVILGNEIYLVDERPSNEHYHFILLAKNAAGHKILRKLSTRSWLNSYFAKGLERVDTLKSDIEELIKEAPGSLIASTACIGGELGKRVLNMVKAEQINDNNTREQEHQKIVEFLLWCKKVFGEDFYLELQPGISKEQQIYNERLLSIAKCFNVKMIITSDTHYLKPEDRYIHKSFLNSKNGEREVDAFYQDTYLHTQEEIFEKLKLSNILEKDIIEMFNNSMEIYNKVEEYSILHTQQIPQVPIEDYPRKKINLGEKYKTLNEMYNSEDPMNRYWVNKCIDRLKEIKKYNPIYLDELEEEAQVKTVVGEKLNTNMFSYPITLSHYINMMWECGSSVGVGRGSACSALNHYLLGITQLDPIEWNFPFFRYMNRERVELGDIDIDVCPSKVQKIIGKIREERSQRFIPEIDDLSKKYLGATYVCTFGTESTKSAILTACRGYRSQDYPDGIEVDIAQYLSSLIPVERGFSWSLKEAYYGDEEKDRKAVKLFKNEIDQYPGLFDIMLGIEGIISRRGRHASGVIFFDEDPYEHACFMKTPSGEIVTQYDLHDGEACGLTKMDILVTEIQDKIVKTIELLQKDEVIDSSLSLKEAYDMYLHPDILPLDDEETWKIIQNAASLDLFQLDSAIGRQGAKKVGPRNMIELSSVNGLIRLMGEKGKETPMEKYIRFRKDVSQWYQEMKDWGLSVEQQQAIIPYLKDTFGIGISQEQLMRSLMDEKICGFSLKDANTARKIIGKKQMNKIPALKEQVLKDAATPALGKYVWFAIVGPQMGYSFSDIHSMSYSFIGFQSAYLATHWDPIYWNTACLIVNSGSLEEESDYDENEDGEIIKKKEKNTDYGKIAKALGDIISRGIKISLVDINKSSYSFEPDMANNEILFGMKALSNVGGPIIEEIIKHRPYIGIADFMARCPLNKSAMFSLIKAGAFDKLEKEWSDKLNIEPRKLVMAYYISKVCEAKKKLTLQNFNGLVEHNLIPQELDLQKRTFNFTKYLKANKKVGQYFVFDNICEDFYNKHFDIDKLEIVNGLTCIKQTVWEKIYKTVMDTARDWLKNNHDDILKKYNIMLFKECWDKYAKGNVSSYEMEALCFYYHDHELKNVNTNKYGIDDFFEMSAEPVVDYYFKKGGREIPIYKISKIIGTVIGKNDVRSSISLLTTTGVVTVKFSKDYYALAARQISMRQTDGTKKVIEKGWFTRGTKLMIAGFRQDDTFVAKTYSKNSFHQLYKITDIKDNGEIELIHERASGGEYDED